MRLEVKQPKRKFLTVSYETQGRMNELGDVAEIYVLSNTVVRSEH